MFVIGWLLGFILPAATGICLVVLTIVLARRRKVVWLIPVSLLSIAVGLVFSFVIAFTLWGLFGPGTAVLISTVLMSPLSFILVVTAGSISLYRTRDVGGFRKALLALYVVGGLVLPISQLVPVAGAGAIWNMCETDQREAASVLIAGLEEYREDHGGYPSRIDELVPGYVLDIPGVPCSSTYELTGELFGSPMEGEYYLNECPSGETLLLVTPSVHGITVQRYNLTAGEWSQIDLLSDGPCDFLEYGNR